MARVVSNQKQAARKKQMDILQARSHAPRLWLAAASSKGISVSCATLKVRFLGMLLPKQYATIEPESVRMQAAQTQIDEDNAKFAKSTEHDMACLQAASQAQFQKLSQQMAGKMASIKQLQEQCQQVVCQIPAACCPMIQVTG